MNAGVENKWNEDNAVSWKKQEMDERLMETKSDIYWVKRNFGEHIKMTGNLIFAQTSQDFLKEIDRQNKLKGENKSE
jgi:hypothetical protein